MRPFSVVLREELEISDMSQVELARKADLSLAMVKKMLSGDRPKPSRDTLMKLAQAMDISPMVFFK